MMTELSPTAKNPEVPPLFPDEVVSESQLRGESAEQEAESIDKQDAPTVEEVTEPIVQPDAESIDHKISIDYAALEAEADAWTQLETPPGGFKDFKELSQQEFEDLLEVDGDEALKYQYRLSRYKEHQRRQDYARSLSNDVIQDAVKEITKIVPDIHTPKPERASELARFAIDNGVDPVILNYITSPNARIHVPGKKPILLGKGAASVVRMLNSLHKKTSQRQPKEQSKETKPSATANKKTALSGLTGLTAERHFSSLSDREQEKLLKGE